MRQRDYLPKKSLSTAPLLYGRYFSVVRGKAEREMEKHFENMQLRKLRKEKLLLLIQLFKDFFKNSPKLLEKAEELFEQWKKQGLFKEIPNAMIQIENLMVNNGFQEEWKAWEKIVSEKFPKDKR